MTDNGGKQTGNNPPLEGKKKNKESVLEHVVGKMIIKAWADGTLENHEDGEQFIKRLRKLYGKYPQNL